MNRYLLGRLSHQVGRTAALVLGILVATASFVVLTGAARTTQLKTVGTVGHNFRSAYDILVRPKGSATKLERSRRLVRPNYLSGIFGGISLAQYHKIEHLPGVQVAAPIAMIGYIVPGVYVSLNVPSQLNGQPRDLYRIDNTWVFDRGLSSARDASGFVYETKSELTLPQELEANGLTTTESVAGRQVPVCRNAGTQKGAGPFAVSVRTYVACFSPDTSSIRPSVVTQWSFPLLIAAIDPTAEAHLVGLNKALVAGRYLHDSDNLTAIARAGIAGTELPVLTPTVSYTDEQLHQAIYRLPAPAAQKVLSAPLTPATAQARFGTTSGSLVSRNVVSAQQAYDRLLAEIHKPSSSSAGIISKIWTPGPVNYDVAKSGLLHPLPVANPPSIWAGHLVQTGFLAAPLASDDVQFRKLIAHSFSDPTDRVASPVLTSVGEFDPARLPGFSALSAVPLETYAPPVAAPGNAAAARELHRTDLLPSGNLGGYLQPPPLVLTTLSALAGLRDAFPSAIPARPISVIRVRVAGVQGVDRLSRARVNAVATSIAASTGLHVDITIGSSPAPQKVLLPAGKFGRPPLVLRENWSRKGVAVFVLDAVDRTSVLLFVLILAVCALLVANAASAAVRARRTELGVLACVGWRSGKLFQAAFIEVGLIGLVASTLGAVLALPLSAAFGLSASPLRGALAIPIATVLTMLAGIAPALRASRSQPAAAVRPAVLPSRSARTPRTVPGLAVTNLLRAPGRSLLGALSLAIGICALTLLLSFTLAFRGQVVGTLLGNAIAMQTRRVDYISAIVTVLIGAAAVADVLYLNIRERVAELATLRAIGWRELTLGRLITLEGAGMGVTGSIIGGATGLALAAVFTGSLPGRLAAAAVISAVIGTLLATTAAVFPASLLGRLAGPQSLAEE